MSVLARRFRKAPLLSSLFATALLFGACSETTTEEPIGECWPIDSAVAGQGSIEIGAGQGNFAAFQGGQDVNVEAGGQGGYHIRVALRIENLDPGDANDILSKKNPRTRMNLIDENGEMISNATCPVRIPYGDKGDGLELLRPYSIVFPISPTVQADYDNQPITVRAEIIDIDGNFAVAEYRMIAKFPELPPTIGSDLSNFSHSPDFMSPAP